MSSTTWAHLFQICLPCETVELSHQQRHFTAAERKGRLCLIACPDGSHGSLRLTRDARIYSTVLDAGSHFCHPLAPGRSAWVHVVRGQVKLPSVDLATGDGVGVTEEASVSLTARDKSEILMIETARP